MANFDITYLGAQSLVPYPNVIYTGYSEGIVTTDLAAYFTTLADLVKGTRVDLYFTAHGSPGADGQIGMGEVEDGFRLTAPMLVELLLDKGIRKLKKLDLRFIFNCCNSAYVTQLDRYQVEPTRDDRVAIIDRSFIGAVHSLLSGKLASLTATGFRGFYCPDARARAPKVSNGKESFSLIDGSATILSNRDLEFGNWTKFRQIQISKFEPKK